MSVESIEHLQRLDAVLFDRPAGRNIVGHAIDTLYRLCAENAAKDARIAELEAALYCENSPYEAKTHRCVHCDEEVLRE